MSFIMSLMKVKVGACVLKSSKKTITLIWIRFSVYSSKISRSNLVIDRERPKLSFNSQK